ncbi:MAG: sensor histidine kinase, partial [Nocardioides sp.]
MSRARLLQLVDLVVVLALAVTALTQVWTLPKEELQGGRAVHMVLVMAFTLPLLLRRRYAVAGFVTVVAAAWLQFELGGGLGQPFFAVGLALYSIGAHASMPLASVGPAAVLVQIALVDVPRLREGEPVDDVVPAWFVLLGIWGLGRWVRHRASESAVLTERAEAAVRDRSEQTARAVAEERARIARELHDLVAHSMGVIVIQAQGAQRALDTAPEQARAALGSIEGTGRTGLEEMRRLLGLLTAAPGPEAGGSSHPQPTLAEVPDLVSRVRDAGLPVDLQVEGDVRTLSPGIELTGFRVVQEAVTNAYKHAGLV